MIVPRNRLLFWIAIVVLPFALLGAAVPAALGLSFAAIIALVLLAGVDALLAPRALSGITVSLPDIVRMSKDREGAVAIRIRNERQRARTLRVGFPIPPQIEPVQENELIALPADTEWSQFQWKCRPVARGSYLLRSVFLEGASPFGFWAIRERQAATAEIRVYPNLTAERRSLAALFLHRGSFGVHAQRQLGKGREFEKLREYNAGDSFDEIHWKATARRGKPITKVFQVERTQEIYVILDASRLSARTVAGANLQVAAYAGSNDSAAAAASNLQSSSILERFISAALVLGLAAEQQGDLFGLLTFSDKVERFIRARNGKAHYNVCRDALYALQPRIVSPDFDELCSFIRSCIRRRALLFFLTSLDDALLAEGFVKNVDLVRRQHLVMVNMLQAPGIEPVFTNPNIASVDQLYEHLGGHLLWHNLRELQRVLKHRGVHFSLLKNERLSTELVSQYLAVKQRQLL